MSLRIGPDVLRVFLVFESFVSTAAHPRDVDIVLIMDASFKLEDAPREARTLFSHADAEARFGASVFWIREGMLAENDFRMFLETWQTKRGRDKARHRGGQAMITNDHELSVMRERVSKLERLLEALRKTARQEEWPALSSGYRLEIERMQGEILDYLVEGTIEPRADAPA
jgi:hypothetical protein